MTATAFNPLATAHELEAAGIERRQAEAIAEGMRRAVRKADLAELRAATRADLYRALWIQGAAFTLIVLIVAAGTGVIVLRAVAPSPDAALQARPAAERRRLRYRLTPVRLPRGPPPIRDGGDRARARS